MKFTIWKQQLFKYALFFALALIQTKFYQQISRNQIFYDEVKKLFQFLFEVLGFKMQNPKGVFEVDYSLHKFGWK